VSCIFFNEGQDNTCPSEEIEIPCAERDSPIRDIGVIMNCQAELFHVVGTLHSSCGFSGGLNGGQEQGDQHADDRNDHQQFDKCEGGSVVCYVFTH